MQVRSPLTDKITDKAIAAIHGDTFIENTSHEGGSFLGNMKFLLPYLKQKYHGANRTEIIALLEDLVDRKRKHPIEATASRENMVYLHKLIRSYAYKLFKKTQSLKIGECFLMDGGWHGCGGGHAMIYIVERTSKDHYAFTVINTGLGLSYHKSARFGYKTKYKPVIRLKDIDKRYLCNQHIFKALLDLKLPFDQNGTDWNHTADDIYVRILSTLNGKRDDAFETQTDSIMAQRSGLCSFKVIMKFIQIKSVNTAEYKSIMFDLKFDSSQTWFDKKNPSDETRQLYKLSAEGFSRWTLDEYKKKNIGPKCLKQAREIGERVLTSIQAQENVLSEKAGEQVKLAKLKPYSVEIAYGNIPSVAKAKHDSRVVQAVDRLSLEELPETIVKINEMIEKALTHCEKLSKHKNYHSIIRTIITMTKLFPCDLYTEKSDWEKMLLQSHKADRLKMMELILNMSQTFFAAIAGLYINERGTPDQMAVMWILMAVNMRLAHSAELKQKTYLGIKEYLNEWMANPFAIIHDKQLSDLFFKSQSYLRRLEENSYSEKSFDFQDVNNGVIELKFTDNGKLFADRTIELSLRKFLNDSRLKDFLFKKFPFLKGQSEFQIIKFILPRMPDVLPPQFMMIFQQHHLFDYLRRNPHLEKIQIKNGVKLGEIKLSIVSENRKKLQVNLDLSGSQNYFTENEIDVKKATYQRSLQFINHHTPITHCGLKQLLRYSRMHLEINMGNCGGKLNKWTNDTSKGATSRKAIKGLTRHETQEIAYLMSKKAVFASNLLSYLKRNYGALFERDFQLLIYHCLFSGNILEETVREFPLVVDKLSDYLLEQLELQNKLGNIEQQLYLLELLKYISFYHRVPTLNVKQRLKKLVGSLVDSTIGAKRLKALVYSQILACYYDQETFTDKDVAKLAVAYAYIKAFGYEERMTHPYVKRYIEDVFSQIRKSKYFQSNKGQENIAKLIAQQVLKYKSGDWHGKHSVFKDRNSNFSIDLSTLSIIDGKKLIGSLPNNITSNSSFQKLFSQKNILAFQTSSGVFTFTLKDCNSNKENYRVYTAEDKQVVIEKQFKHQWWQHVSLEILKSKFPDGLLVGCCHWILFDVSTDQFEVSIHRSADIIKIASAKGKRTSDGLNVDKIIRISPGNIEDGAVLQEQDESILSRFQGKEFYLNWDNKFIEFPLAKFSFKTNQQGHKIFSEDKSLKLSKKQNPPHHLPTLNRFFSLENNAGEKTYLFPRETIDLVALGQGALKRTLKLNYCKNDGRYFQIYENNGELTGTTAEENLFLAYLHLAHKQYEQAYRLLDQKLSGHPRGYSSNVEEIVTWCIEMINSTCDASPQAQALHLELLFLCKQNLKPDFKNRILSDLEGRVGRVLHTYYPVAHHVKTLTPRKLKNQDRPKININHPMMATRYLSSTIGAKRKEMEFEDLIKESELDEIKKKLEKNITASKKEMPLFFLEGEKWLTSKLNIFMLQLFFGSESDKIKLRTELQLLKFSKERLFSKLRDLLILISIYKKDKNLVKLKGVVKNNLSLSQIIQVLQIARLSLSLKLEKKVVSHDIPVPLLVLPGIKHNPQKQKTKQAAAKLNFKVEDVSVLSETNILKLCDIELKQTKKQINIDINNFIQCLSFPKDYSNTRKTEFNRIYHSIQSYQRSLSNEFNYELSDMTKLNQMIERFSKRLMHLQDNAQIFKNTVLEIANSYPSTGQASEKHRLKLLGKKKKQLGIDDLIIAFLQDNTDFLIKQNSHLNSDSINNIAKMLIGYMMLTTESHHITRLVSLAKKVTTTTDDKQQEHLSELDATLKKMRNYKPQEDRVVLIFEYYSQKRLRKNQVDLIKEFIAAKGDRQRNLIKQLIMAFGKTKIVSPLLAFLLSQGDNVLAILVPDMLYETNLEDMRIFSGRLLHQNVYTLEFEEEAYITDSEIDLTMDICKKIKRERSYCLLKASTVHALILNFKEVIIDLGSTPLNEKPPQALVDRYKKLRTALNDFLQDAILDEADMLLDCLKEVNFSSGKWMPVINVVQDTMEHIFLKIAENKLLRDFFQLEEENDQPFDEIKYNNEMKPLLRDIILSLTEHKSWSQEQLVIVRKYLLSDKSITEKPKFIINSDRDTRKTIALGRGLLFGLFPFTLTRKCNLNFGESEFMNVFKAIYYSDKDQPSEGSEFLIPYIAMIYTTFLYCRKGVSLTKVKALIKECKEQALTEHQVDGIPFEKTKGYARFSRLNLIQGRGLFSLRDDEIEDAVKRFNQDISNRICFSREFGWRQIGRYSRRLTSTTQHLAGAFVGCVFGFSGDLWNKGTFSPLLNAVPDETADGKTLCLLKESNPSINVHNSLNDLYKSLDGYNACIDTGAWFRGIGAKKIALTMLDHLPDTIKAVVYFNDQDIPLGTKGQAVVLERGKLNDEPTLLSKTSLQEEERFTYYNVTTGADIKQHGHAKAITTISLSMILRDLLQGVWRMRGLAQNQKTDFAVPKTLAPALLKKLASSITVHDDLDDFYESLAAYDACIDRGEWFKGLSAHEVAMKMLKHLPNTIKAVVYFDKEKAVVLERGKESEALRQLSETSFSKEEYFTYYNTTAAIDNRQSSHAKVITTISKPEILHEYLQENKHEKNKHKSDVAIKMDLLPRLNTILLIAIFKFLICNQADRQEDDNYQALEQKFSYAAESIILDFFKKPDTSITDAVSLGRSVIDLLAPEVSMDPCDLFEDIEETVAIKEVVNHSITDVIEEIQPIYTEHPYLRKCCSLDTLNKDMHQLVDYNGLPKEKKQRKDPGYGMKMKVRTKVKQKVKVKTKLKIELVEDNKNPKGEVICGLYGWRLGNIFFSNYWNIDGTTQSRSVNEFLISRAHELDNYDAKDKVFSEQLWLTDGVACILPIY